jgi:hypothetical protein
MTCALWGELGVGAGGPGAGPPPARPFGKQDAADLAAAHPDALGLGGLGEGVQGPVRRRLGLGGASSPSPPWCSRPGGAERARAMIRPRSVSLSRRGRPGPGRSPSPSTPSALNRCSRSRTVWGGSPAGRRSGWCPGRPSCGRSSGRAGSSRRVRAGRRPACGWCALRRRRAVVGRTAGRARRLLLGAHHRATVYAGTPPIPTLRNGALVLQSQFGWGRLPAFRSREAAT